MMPAMIRVVSLLLPLLLALDGCATSNASAAATTGKPASGLASLTQGLTAAAPRAGWRVTFGTIFWAVVVFVAALLILRYLTKLMEVIAERWHNLRLVVKRLIPIVRVAGWTIVTYVIVEVVFAPPIETLLALTASAGIAIGLASQDILKNILGGIIILFDRPFQVGD